MAMPPHHTIAIIAFKPSKTLLSTLFCRIIFSIPEYLGRRHSVLNKSVCCTTFILRRSRGLKSHPPSSKLSGGRQDVCAFLASAGDSSLPSNHIDRGRLPITLRMVPDCLLLFHPSPVWIFSAILHTEARVQELLPTHNQ